MKLMRSRFRLISLLLTCVFLLTVVICAVSALRQAGIDLPSVQSVLPVPSSPEISPASPSPGDSPSDEEPTPAPSAAEADEQPAGENLPEKTDIPSDSEYNIFGL